MTQLLEQNAAAPALSDADKALVERWPVTLGACAAWLAPRDRMLVELQIVRRVSCRVTARLLGLHAGNVTRRVRRLRQLTDNHIVASLLANGARLEPMTRELALMHFVGGLNHSKLSDRFGIERVTVKRRLDFVRGWARGFRVGVQTALDTIHESRDDNPGDSPDLDPRPARSAVHRRQIFTLPRNWPLHRSL